MQKTRQDLEKAEVHEPELTREERPTYSPATDIYSREDSIVVVADLPGVPEKNLDVHLEENVLTITGRAEEHMPEGGQAIYRDYEPGVFTRSFTLPADVDRGRIQAQLKNGVLTVVLPKSAETRPRKIPVKME